MKFRNIILITIITIIIGFPPAALAATLSLSPATGTFNQGCNFSLDVVVDTLGAQTDGTDAILIYDPTRFTGLTITNGTIYPDFPGNNINDTTGKITISGLASVNTPFAGKGTLASVQFSVRPAAPTGATQITFDFDSNNKGETRDSNVVERGTVVDVLNSVVNGNYIIGTGSCGSQTAVTPTPRPRGGPQGTPSAQPKPFPPDSNQLPPAGTAELTFAIAIVGGVLTVLGILGLALL